MNSSVGFTAQVFGCLLQFDLITVNPERSTLKTETRLLNVSDLWWSCLLQ